MSDKPTPETFREFLIHEGLYDESAPPPPVGVTQKIPFAGTRCGITAEAWAARTERVEWISMTAAYTTCADCLARRDAPVPSLAGTIFDEHAKREKPEPVNPNEKPHFREPFKTTMKLEQESAQRRVRILVRGHSRVPEGRCVLASCDGVAARHADKGCLVQWPEENGLILMPRFPVDWLTVEEMHIIEIEACASLGLDWTIIRAKWIGY